MKHNGIKIAEFKMKKKFLKGSSLSFTGIFLNLSTNWFFDKFSIDIESITFIRDVIVLMLLFIGMYIVCSSKVVVELNTDDLEEGSTQEGDKCACCKYKGEES